MSYWSKYPMIQQEIDIVENFMKENVVSKKKILTDISLDLISSGGKRIRPAFVILAAQSGKKFNRDIIIPLASAMELIHTATLVHDDIIDESKFRRGKETVHKKWGKDMAVYVGDYLLSKAFCILSDKTSIDRLKYVSNTVKSICEGEISQYESRYNVINTYDYIKRITRKTALLFALSFNAGAKESKCDKKTLRALTNFGINYGIAFQINDDLLDYTSNESLIGKPIGNDVKQGYYSLPLLTAIKDQNKGEDIRLILETRESITDTELNHVLSLVKKTKAIEKSKSLALRYVKKAEKSLDEIKNKEVVEILSDILYKI